MALSICPGCKQNADRDAGFCSLCGFDFSSDRVEAYNRRITWWMRASCFACGLVSYIAVRSMGRRPGFADYRNLLLVELLSAALIYAGLKLMFPRSRRKLWHTALIPSFLILAGMFVWRACQGTDSSLSLNRLMGASPASASVVPAAPAGPAGPAVSGIRITRADPAAARAAAHATSQPSQSKATPPQTQLPPPPQTRDDFAALLPIANDCLNLMRRQPEFIDSEVKGAGVDRMLLPASLENAKQLDASRVRVRRLAERLAAYETRVRKNAADMTAKVNSAAAPEKVRANFLTEVRRSGGEFVRGVLEFAVVERKYVSATDDMLAFLRARTDKFTVINKRPMFAAAADSKKYDALRKTIDDLSARADQLLPHVRTLGERAIRELNSPSDADSPPLTARATADAGR